MDNTASQTNLQTGDTGVPRRSRALKRAPSDESLESDNVMIKRPKAQAWYGGRPISDYGRRVAQNDAQEQEDLADHGRGYGATMPGRENKDEAGGKGMGKHGFPDSAITLRDTILPAQVSLTSAQPPTIPALSRDTTRRRQREEPQRQANGEADTPSAKLSLFRNAANVGPGIKERFNLYQKSMNDAAVGRKRREAEEKHKQKQEVKVSRQEAKADELRREEALGRVAEADAKRRESDVEVLVRPKRPSLQVEALA